MLAAVFGTQALVGCGDSATDSELVFIPDVQLECEGGQASGCLQEALNVFTGIQKTSTMPCDALMSGMSASQRRMAFIATADSVSNRTGNYLTAIATNWRNSSGGRVDVLPSGTYSVCAFVDVNGNGQLDLNEPLGQGSVTLGVTGARITEWAPSSR